MSREKLSDEKVCGDKVILMAGVVGKESFIREAGNGGVVGYIKSLGLSVLEDWLQAFPLETEIAVPLL